MHAAFLSSRHVCVSKCLCTYGKCHIQHIYSYSTCMDLCHVPGVQCDSSHCALCACARKCVCVCVCACCMCACMCVYVLGGPLVLWINNNELQINYPGEQALVFKVIMKGCNLRVEHRTCLCARSCAGKIFAMIARRKHFLEEMRIFCRCPKPKVLI